MVVAIGYGAKITVTNQSGNDYTDIIEIDADTRGILLDKMVEAAYHAYDHLLQRINVLHDQNISTTDDYWFVNVTYPALTAESELRHAGSSVQEPLDIVRSVAHYRHMEIERARNAILFPYSHVDPKRYPNLAKTNISSVVDTDFNYLADLDSLKNEGYQGADWDTDFALALRDGRWNNYLTEQKQLSSAYNYKQQMNQRVHEAYARAEQKAAARIANESIHPHKSKSFWKRWFHTSV